MGPAGFEPDQVSDPWVLVTMDLSIVEDFKGFVWNRYAIAGCGDHFTYTPERHDKHPPSVASMTEKRI